MVLHPVEESCYYQSELQNVRAGGFRITGPISDCGSHGYVVSCTDQTKRLYAMKIARDYNEIATDVAAFSEIATHCSIKSLSSVDLRIPRLRSIFAQYGREVLVMESLGPDLAVLREAQKNRRFSLKTVLQIAVSLLTAYEQLHNTGWLHLTAKPRNFCIGGTAATKHKIYAVDFGRAQRYMEMDLQWGLNHRPFLTGVCESPQAEPFQSVWGEKENTNTSRRDDMMSLSLALLYI
jgi:serine/threonine protein kinase